MSKNGTFNRPGAIRPLPQMGYRKPLETHCAVVIPPSFMPSAVPGCKQIMPPKIEMSNAHLE